MTEPRITVSVPRLWHHRPNLQRLLGIVVDDVSWQVERLTTNLYLSALSADQLFVNKEV